MQPDEACDATLLSVSVSGGFLHSLDKDRVTLLVDVGLAPEVDIMAGTIRLGFKIKSIVWVGGQQMRNASGNLHAVTLELANFVWVVGHETHGLHVQAVEHVGRHGIISFIIPKTQGKIRFHRVQTLVLQRVSADLVDQSNASPFLTKIKHDSAIQRADFSKRRFQLVPTITT